ncbi:hypothetical protein RFI_08380 [Reticulomyxa filosa]|uniref:Glycosyl hydrolases family 2 sugar binding domain-containing protein n=1 Tax=Reticulomyxa filosa TaxID=46433 RepID=X6NTY4_RETFI|nr:hypothetical protein RFI_08380 [Reticulomyxa filosa]|eukprot:ETO28752.1 hypothetical protein RFI_08380 [Reticulomyxa filosa]
MFSFLAAFCVWFLFVALVESWSRTSCGPTDQITQWGSQVTPNNTLPEYPRPQMVRKNNWLNMNGLWQLIDVYFVETTKTKNKKEEYETGSKVIQSWKKAKHNGYRIDSKTRYQRQYYNLHYRTTFTDFADRNKSDTRLLLNFGAVDWDTTVYVNNEIVGTHIGGYDSFVVDITKYVNESGNTLDVMVFDPTEYGQQPNGRQSISAMTEPGGSVFTPTSGIWQTVWLEFIPMNYIEGFQVITSPDLQTVSITVTVNGDPSSEQFTVKVYDSSSNKLIITATADCNEVLLLQIQNATLWSPDFPFLYDMTV